ncbi:hypothetical protein [Reyranella sp.]|uniref:hypothetical protein n=1 Tax=Reyranella sp. TaxID=1929291 RepID=UPI003BAB6293
MKPLIAIAALAGAVVSLPALAATDQECQDLWTKADTNADGVLSDGESVRYVALMRIGNRTVAAEGRITRDEFMAACKGDSYAYATQANEAGAPLKGANSFTEGQAKDRATARGLANVSALEKDGDGIWRGTATGADGKSVSVAIDYKGNVVATAP